MYYTLSSYKILSTHTQPEPRVMPAEHGPLSSYVTCSEPWPPKCTTPTQSSSRLQKHKGPTIRPINCGLMILIILRRMKWMMRTRSTIMRSLVSWPPFPMNACWPVNASEHIRNINDPEHPLTLEQLAVVSARQVEVNGNTVMVEFTPTVPHCGASTLIGVYLTYNWYSLSYNVRRTKSTAATPPYIASKIQSGYTNKTWYSRQWACMWVSVLLTLLRFNIIHRLLQ